MSSYSSGRRARSMGWVAAAGVAVVGYAALIERRNYTLRDVRMPVLPSGAHSVRMLHISDLHLTPTQRDKIAWLKTLAFVEPDVVIDTGDNVGRADAIPALAEALGPLLDTAPGVFVDGSNDFFAPIVRNPFAYLVPRRTPVDFPQDRSRIDTDSIHSLFTDNGWSNLNDATWSLSARGSDIFFVGTGDAHMDAADVDALLGRADEVDAARAAGATIIGVTHAPYRRVLDAFVAVGVDAIFAGHTHGGQVCVPGFGALTTNCDLPLSQAKGLSTWTLGQRSVPLHVSAGLGTSIFAPVRLACRPEVTLVTLTARA